MLKYLDLNYDNIFKYKTIIIQSDTGSGKANIISKNMKQNL